MPDPRIVPQFTADEKRREALRELGQRESVYPRLVANGRLTQRQSDRQIALIREIAADYAEQARKEQLL